EIDNKAGRANSLNQLGNIESKLEHDEEAVLFYRKSLAISEELQTQPLIVSNLNDLGESYFNLRQYDKAIDCFKKAINIAKIVGLKIELDHAYGRLAD